MFEPIARHYVNMSVQYVANLLKAVKAIIFRC